MAKKGNFGLMAMLTYKEYKKMKEDEKYAWRSWCEDGSEYGINPIMRMNMNMKLH